MFRIHDGREQTGGRSQQFWSAESGGHEARRLPALHLPHLPLPPHHLLPQLQSHRFTPNTAGYLFICLADTLFYDNCFKNGQHIWFLISAFVPKPPDWYEIKKVNICLLNTGNCLAKYRYLLSPFLIRYPTLRDKNRWSPCVRCRYNVGTVDSPNSGQRT